MLLLEDRELNSIRIGNAPCSWGILEFQLEGETYPSDQVLDKMQRGGYAGTELGDPGFLPEDPRRLRFELEERSLELVGAFVPLPFSRVTELGSRMEAALATARTIAAAGYRSAFLILSDDNGTLGEPEMPVESPRRWV